MFTTAPKTLFFWAFFEIFVFHFSYKKTKTKKCTFFFRKLFFWQPDKLPKYYFRTPTHYLCFFKIPNKHSKIGEKQATKNLGPSFDATLDQVLTLKNPNLGPSFDSTPYIYIYISICLYTYKYVWRCPIILGQKWHFYAKHRWKCLFVVFSCAPGCVHALSGLVAAILRFAAALAALILRLRPAGCDLGSPKHHTYRGGLGLRFSNRSGLRPVAIWLCGHKPRMSFPLGNRLRFQVRVGAAGDVATQIASDLRARVEGH